MLTKLYGILPSPPVRSVLLCASALDIKLDFININLLEGEHMKQDFLKKNPQHTVPVLEEDDGFIVSDSHAIMAYLVSKYGKDDSLYPAKDLKRRAIIDQRLHFDSSTLFTRAVLISKPLLFENIYPSKERLDALDETLNIVDQILATNNSGYIAGDQLSIADFSFITSLTASNLFVPYSKFPNIKAYIDKMEKMPFYKENVEGLSLLHELFRPKLKNNP